MTRATAGAGAFLALALVAAVLVGQILGASGPEGAIVTHLKELERDGASFSVSEGLLTGSAQFARISLTLDQDGQTATVTSTVDFTGRFSRPGTEVTRVSSLGLERARYVLRGGDWVAEAGDCPRLLGIVRALEGRRLAIEQRKDLGDGGVFYAEVEGRTFSSHAWFIRSEREDVTVTEDSRLVGVSPDRPVDQLATTRLTLREEERAMFSFLGGIL